MLLSKSAIRSDCCRLVPANLQLNDAIRASRSSTKACEMEKLQRRRCRGGKLLKFQTKNRATRCQFITTIINETWKDPREKKFSIWRKAEKTAIDGGGTLLQRQKAEAKQFIVSVWWKTREISSVPETPHKLPFSHIFQPLLLASRLFFKESHQQTATFMDLLLS